MKHLIFLRTHYKNEKYLALALLSISLLLIYEIYLIYLFSGDVYNVGMSIVKGGLRHVVVKFPYSEKGKDAHRLFHKILIIYEFVFESSSIN